MDTRLSHWHMIPPQTVSTLCDTIALYRNYRLMLQQRQNLHLSHLHYSTMKLFSLHIRRLGSATVLYPWRLLLAQQWQLEVGDTLELNVNSYVHKDNLKIHHSQHLNFPHNWFSGPSQQWLY